MVNFCAALGCSNEYNPGKPISFFSFPFNRPDILVCWIKSIRRDKWYPTKSSKLCSEHFLPSDFLERPGCIRKLLKPDSVPSIFQFSKLWNPQRRKLIKKIMKPAEDSSVITMEHAYAAQNNMTVPVKMENNDSETINPSEMESNYIKLEDVSIKSEIHEDTDFNTLPCQYDFDTSHIKKEDSGDISEQNEIDSIRDNTSLKDELEIAKQKIIELTEENNLLKAENELLKLELQQYSELKAETVVLKETIKSYQTDITVKMDSESENEMDFNQTEDVEMSSLNLLPENSKKLYVSAYESFLSWREVNNLNSLTESTLLVYFTELSKKYKSSTLWTYYSMLKSTINMKHGINIENYQKLQALLKRKSQGFTPRKAKTFSLENVSDFLTTAPDEKYLATKVALIMGIIGSCQAKEMYRMKMSDLTDLGSTFQVNVPNVKTKITRKFTIGNQFYNICKRYINNRPAHCTSDVFFLHVQNGKCFPQKIGINKFTRMGKDIANFLHLPHPEMYSGHSFRRSSATLFVDADDGDVKTSKRLVAETSTVES